MTFRLSLVRLRLLIATLSIVVTMFASEPATAATLPFTGSLSVRILALDPIELPGSGDATASLSGQHLDAIAIPSGAFGVSGFVVPTTDPGGFPIAGLQMTAANDAGSFATGPAFGGQMPLNGVMKVCLFAACPEAVANLDIPLGVAGNGGTALVTGAVNLTVVGAPWTTGTAAVGAMTAMGERHGPESNTSSTARNGGVLNLVSPVFISTNIGASSVIPAFAFLKLNLFGSSACADQEDNDGDGLLDFPADPGCESVDDDSEQSSSLVCDDGIDNDGDGVADVPSDPGCSNPTDDSERAAGIACDDGIDNDGDGRTDVPSDPGCAGPGDGSELGTLACDDGSDNDGDGLSDRFDPSCSGPADASEKGALICDDGADNDADGLIDFPADTGCESLTDPSERLVNTACEDGADNDGDGFVDFPADPGCSSAADRGERSFALGCDDGLDNDGDLTVDYPGDPGCAHPTDPFELSAFLACDDGLDNDGDGVVDRADPGCSSLSDSSERASGVACDDDADNDGDGAADYPEDPGCAGPGDGSERASALVCDDGLDNDGDGSSDHPNDPGCDSSVDGSERSPALVCDDEIDNDGDGLADRPADPGCDSPADASERAAALVCDDGTDNDGDGLSDAADPGCTGPADPSEQNASVACDDGIDNDADGSVDFGDDLGCVSAADSEERDASASVIATRVLEFSEVALLNASPVQTLRVRNDGTEPLRVLGVSKRTTPGCASFQLSAPALPTTVEPGDEAGFPVQFAPTSAGRKSCEVDVTTTDPNIGAQIASLYGTGDIASQIRARLSTASTSVVRGATLPFALTIQNTSANQETFYLTLVLTPPGSSTVTLLPLTSFTLPAGATPTLNASLPISPGLPTGVYSFAVGIVRQGDGVIDSSFANFEVR